MSTGNEESFHLIMIQFTRQLFQLSCEQKRVGWQLKLHGYDERKVRARVRVERNTDCWLDTGHELWSLMPKLNVECIFLGTDGQYCCFTFE